MAGDGDMKAGLRPMPTVYGPLAVGLLRRRKEMRGPETRPRENGEEEQENADSDGEGGEDRAAPVVVVPEVARKEGVNAGEDESERQETEEQTFETMAASGCRRWLRHEGTAVPVKTLAGCRGSWNAVF